MNKHPNILLITTDQQRWDHLGLTGVKGIKTPALDRLGSEGIHFNRAYCPSPMCTPSRVSLLTGQFPSSHGAYSIGVTSNPLPSLTVADALSEAGYHTALFGKTHFVKRADEEGHMSGLEKTDSSFWDKWSGPYLGFQEIQTSIGHTTNANPNQHYRDWLESKGVDWKAWFPQAQGKPFTPYKPGKWEIPAEFHDTEWVTQCVESYIDKKAENDAPWFCWASYQDPHEPYLCPDPWFSKVDMSAVNIFPPKGSEEFADKPDVYHEIHDINAVRTKYNTDGFSVPCAYTQSFSEEEQRNALQATLGMVAFIDHAVGRILAKLEAKNELENTIIVFTSDHGEYHGNHGFWGKGIPAYEDAQRVPLLIRGPSIPHRKSSEAIINLVDLPKTFLRLASATIPRGMQGNDLTPGFENESNLPTETVVECRPNESGIYQQSFITQKYKLVIYKHTDDGELYDLESDPDQYVNLWDRAEMKAIKMKLLLKFAQFNLNKDGHINPRTAFA